ncbi:MAG: hypothetical protein DRP52_01325 [Planctomycetota bacterium]|nr:MAG: hypothetical protein DRP52_01325 [Planctomycetota bacterium]
MAKKLNKKVAIIGIALLVLMLAAGSGLLIVRHARRNPDRALKQAQLALEAGDYEQAEVKLGRAYAFGKTDADKIERLFELVDLHLIHNDQHEADWAKVMGCWNKIVTIDPQNLAARRKLLDFYYQAAEAGDARAWRTVEENTTELIDALKAQDTEPDTFLLIAHAKALLSIAQRGDTTDRRGPLNECIILLKQLIETEPQNGELYTLMADATILEGELNALAGVIEAREKAQKKALGLLETAIEQSDDKPTAVADLMLYKMRTSRNDPNTLEAIRVEIDQRSQQVQPNDKLLLVTSIAYETLGKMSAEAEINRAIEAIRQAHALKPNDFEYTLRMARLLYRKGNAFNDPAAVADALQIAEDAMSLEEVQDAPGPLQGRNLNYRFALNNFLTNFYLEKALAAKDAGQLEETENYTQKAEARITEIVSTMGSTDNPMIQKYQGLVALAKGEPVEATRLLYKAYEANKALDKPGEPSNVDSRVCVALARIAGQQGQFGLQKEFIEGVFASRDRLVLQKPQLLLDYARVLKRFGAWNIVMQLAENYQKRYGANEQSRSMILEASIALGEFDKAGELLASYEGSLAEKSRYELNILVSQTARLKQTIASLKEQKEEPTSEQAQELKTLREKRNELLDKILKADPKEVNPQILAGICVDMIQNGQTAIAVEHLDTYLAANPDVLNLMILRLQAQQEDPLNLTPDQQTQLRQQAINALTDAKQKAVLLAGSYRLQGDFEKALQTLEQNPQVDADDPDIVQVRFDIALEQKDFQAAQSLQQTIRTENIDRCDGNLAAARLEMVQENYQAALRRLDECVSLHPLYSYTYFLKSQVLTQLEDEEGSIESARMAIRMDPQNASYMRQLASLLFARNVALGSKMTKEQEAEAEQAIMMSIRLNPTDQQLQSVYAESIQLRDPDRAILIRQKLLESNPSASNALMLGNMALRMAGSEWDAAKKTGLIELAGNAYQKGMDAEPDNETLRQAYADYQQRSGKGEEAIELLKGDKNLEWKFYLRNGQFEQAEAILKDLLGENPDDPLLVQGLVLVSQGAGHRDRIKQYLNTLAKLDETKEMQLWVLQKYIDNGYTEEAQKKLASFRERFPDEKAALLIEAWTQMGKGRLDEALALVNRYLETDTNSSGAWRLRGRLYRLMNQPRKAIDDLQHSKGIQDTPAVRMELAAVYTELNQVTAAIGELVPSLDDPKSPVQIRLMLESLYQKNNRISDLDKFYQMTLEKYPQSVFWLYRAGLYYLNQGTLVKAQELLKASWQISTEQGRPDAGAIGGYLESLYRAKQYDQAFSIASGQIDTPAAPLVYTFMAQVHFQKGRKDEAIQSFYTALDKAATNDGAQGMISQKMLDTVGKEAAMGWISDKLTADENSLPAHLLAARLAQRDNSYNEAIEHINKCIDSLGEGNPAWLGFALKKVNLLIMAYTKTADQSYWERATALLEEMLQLQPNNSSLLNNMAYLLADNDQQLETALEYARKAHQGDPGNAVFLDTYAYVQCKTGQYKQAEQNLIRAIQIYEVSDQPMPWDLYKHLAMAKEGLGKAAQAIEMYQKALDASDEIPEKEKQRLQAAIERLQQT